jgi:formylglycine-generating enzyme required for sulfatase activity
MKLPNSQSALVFATLAVLFAAVTSAEGQTTGVVKAVLVDAGTFLQGKRTLEPVSPGRRVTVSPYYMSETEITQGQYKTVTGLEPSLFHSSENPVERVSWYDAVGFCNKLSALDGLKAAYLIEGSNVTWDRTSDGWRLPTEAEFEFAARGGAQGHDFDFPGSNTADDVGWSFSTSGKQTRPVRSLKPNELGLYGLAGNVWEWCWDWYAFDRSAMPSMDPSGPQVGTDRINRGGGWNDDFVDSMRPYFRADDGPDSKDSDLGFRVVRTSLGL